MIEINSLGERYLWYDRTIISRKRDVSARTAE